MNLLSFCATEREETISGNGRRLDGGCGIGAYDRMLLFDKKEVIAWNMVNFRSVKYGI